MLMPVTKILQTSKKDIWIGSIMALLIFFVLFAGVVSAIVISDRASSRKHFTRTYGFDPKSDLNHNNQFLVSNKLCSIASDRYDQDREYTFREARQIAQVFGYKAGDWYQVSFGCYPQ